MSGEYAVGIDLGATNVRVGIGDSKGRIPRKLSEKTDKQHGPKGIPLQIIRMIHHLIKDGELKVRGIGVASIGPLDLREGVIVNSPNIPFKHMPIIEPLRSEFNAPINFLNDCDAAVICERKFGAGRGIDNLVYITLSTGIGAGVYVDGCLLRGKDGNASEVGHLVIDFEGRLKCGCGKKGHWEAYCSARNIPQYVKMLLKERSIEDNLLTRSTGGASPRITAKKLYETARSGDALSLEIVDSIGRLNAAGFGSVINAYDPSLITVGGALALKNENLVMEPIKRYVHDYAVNRVPEITVTPLGENVVLLGAIAAVYMNDSEPK